MRFWKSTVLQWNKPQKAIRLIRECWAPLLEEKKRKNSWELPLDEVYPSVVDIESAPKNGEEIIVSFQKGLPTAINGKLMSGIKMMGYLDKFGAKHGVGKGMHLGNTILGIKGRIVFEGASCPNFD